MKLISLTVLLLLTSLLTIVAQAQTTFERSIYLVDMQKVISESIAGKAARNNLESEMKKRQLELERRKLELDRLRSELTKQASVLSKDAVDQKAQQVRRREREFVDELEDHKREFTKKNAELIGRLVKEIDGVLAELAKNEGFDFVLERDRRFVVFAEKQRDISARVIEELDKKRLNL